MLTSLMRIALTRSFKPFEFTGPSDGAPDYSGLKLPGLYVHIPFCRSLCSFCPYCKQLFDAETASKYAGALLSEIDLVCKNSAGITDASSLYFGGGTPALMLDYIPLIINRLSRYFTITGGIGVELHPDDITEDTLAKLRAAGVTMLSVGVQSFDGGCLSKIGRENSGFTDKLKLITVFGFDVLDVDLIFGIPGQTDATLDSDIRTAFESGATQVSTYPFIDFSYADNSYKPLPHRQKKRMLNKLSQICQDIGAERTSVWTFARKGTEKYSSVTRTAFLGFGASSVSLLKHSFLINTFSVPDYITAVSAGSQPTALTLEFKKRQREVYYLFWSVYGLRVDSAAYSEFFGKPLGRMFGFELFLSRLFGYAKKQGADYVLTDRGALLYHRIEQEYTAAYIDKMWSVCRTTPFPEKLILK